MDRETLRKVQLAQLDMALEVKRICEKYKIQFFLYAGSVLGAIRHHGFIPWDDDLDIVMLREDYDLFKNICKTELNEEYFYQDWETDAGYALPFAKIRIRNSKYTEETSQCSSALDGIYIDIFPFDHTMNRRHDELVAMYKFYVLRRMYFAKQGYCPSDITLKKTIVYGLLKVIFFPKKKILQLMENIMRANSNGASDYIVVYGGAYGYWKDKVPKKWFKKEKIVDFEGEKFPIPFYYEQYLTSLYGDYMTPTPESERGNRHKIVNVDFGEYIIKSIKKFERYV